MTEPRSDTASPVRPHLTQRVSQAKIPDGHQRSADRAGQDIERNGEHEEIPESDDEETGGDEETDGRKIGSETLAHDIRCMS